MRPHGHGAAVQHRRRADRAQLARRPGRRAGGLVRGEGSDVPRVRGADRQGGRGAFARRSGAGAARALRAARLAGARGGVSRRDEDGRGGGALQSAAARGGLRVLRTGEPRPPAGDLARVHRARRAGARRAPCAAQGAGSGRVRGSRLRALGFGHSGAAGRNRADHAGRGGLLALDQRLHRPAEGGGARAPGLAALLRAVRARSARARREGSVPVGEQAVPRVRARQRPGVPLLGGREHGPDAGQACARPDVPRNPGREADRLLRRADALCGDAGAEGRPARSLLLAALRVRRRATARRAVLALEDAIRNRDPRRDRLDRGPPHLHLATQGRGKAGLDGRARGRVRGPDHRRDRRRGEARRDGRPDRARAKHRDDVLQPPGTDAREDARRVVCHRRQVPPDRGRRVPLRGPLRRHVQGWRRVGLADRRGGSPGFAQGGAGSGGDPARRRRPAAAAGACGADAGPGGGTRAGGRAAPARAREARGIHGPEADPLRGRASEDGDGEDPALRPARRVGVKINGADLHVEDTGGPGRAVLFSHGLLWSTAMWRYQMEVFRDRYRCIAWDHRGQGQSEVTARGYDMDALTADAVALIEALGVAPVHFVGLSMGGFVGMRIAARRPELLRSLVLMETASDREPRRNIPKYAAMNFLAGFFGTGPFVPSVMKIMFGRSFLNDPSREELRADLRRQLLANDVAGMRRAVNGVITRKPLTDNELGNIRVPTLVLSGGEDAAVIPARSMRTAARIPGAKFLGIPRAGHSACLEEPNAVNRALADFWDSLRAQPARVEPYTTPAPASES